MFLLCTLSNCKNKRVAFLYAKQKALGKVLEVGVVAPDSVWQGRQGAYIRAFLARTNVYTCLHIQPEDTVHFAGLHRNLLHILPARVGKLTRLLDQRALGQTTQYLPFSPAPSPTDSLRLAEALAYVWQEEKARLRTYTFTFEDAQSSVLERWVGKHYPFKMRLLPTFQVWNHASPTLLWLKTDRGEEKHIYITASKQENPALLPPIYQAEKYTLKTIWRDGFQITFLIRKDTKKTLAHLLEMEALLETWVRDER
ncbi:MAG: hypothetical protein EAZ95_13475 [Bacteroidetes bacterium]|nr:MAG: hypothetical protein EAZ95_13475 [Bacteroidota bacterium]